jgi:hypothetical protein
MVKLSRRSSGSLRRRDFLALATAGAVSVVTGLPGSKSESATLPALAAGQGGKDVTKTGSNVLARPTPEQAQWQDYDIGIFYH